MISSEEFNNKFMIVEVEVLEVKTVTERTRRAEADGGGPLSLIKKSKADELQSHVDELANVQSKARF